MKIDIGFVGAGNMAQAIIGGYLQAQGTSLSSRVMATNRNPQKSQILYEKFPQLTRVDNNAELARNCKVVVIGVKPKDIESACREIAPYTTSDHLVISLAAGVTTNTIADCFVEKPAIIRAMPNTPALIGQGMTGLFAANGIETRQREFCERLFKLVGDTLWLNNEDDMHAVTAVSGSGPAYLFYFAENLIKAGVEQGLSEPAAKTLALKTIQGASNLMFESSLTPESLRQQVSSPGGTTQAAIERLQAQNFSDILNEAVAKATERSKALS